MSMIAVFIGRLFISLIFIVSGINKLIHVNDTNAMITAAGLPAGLAIPTGLFELVAGEIHVFHPHQPQPAVRPGIQPRRQRGDQRARVQWPGGRWRKSADVGC